MSHRAPHITPQIPPAKRMALQNEAYAKLWDLEDRVNEMAAASGGAGFDPGDLNVYYENGKA